MDLVLEESKIEGLEAILDQLIKEGGASFALLTDLAGNMICSAGDTSLDSTSLAVLSAANFAATREIAKIIGEKEFSLLFHKGENENIHFTHIPPEFLLIVLFKPHISLGLLRLKTDAVRKNVQSFLKD